MVKTNTASISFKTLVGTFLKKAIVRNIFWLSFDKVFKLLLGVIVGAAVARYLGPAQWGKINYILAFISIAATIATLGLDSLLIKELLERPHKKNELLGTAFFLRCGVVVVLLLASLAIFFFTGVEKEYYSIFVWLFLTVIVSPLELIDIDFQSSLNSKDSVQPKSIAYVAGAVLKIIAIVTKMPLIYFVAIIGLETVIASILLVGKYHQRKHSIFLWHFDKQFIFYLLNRAWPFLLSSISVILYMRLDQIMLGNLLNLHKVGDFSAAVRVSEIFLFIPVAITGSYYGSLIGAKKLERKAYESKVQQLFNLMFFVSFLLAVIISILSPFIIAVLYGKSFTEAPAILRIHVWSLVAVFLGVAGSQYLVIENMQKISFYCTLLGLISNVLLNFFLIPLYGGQGAALATLISYFLSAVVGNFIFKRSRPVFKYQVNSLRILFKPKALFLDAHNTIA